MVRAHLIAGLALVLTQPVWAGGLMPAVAADLARDALTKAGLAGADPVPPSRPLPACDTAVTVEPPAPAATRVTLRCATPPWSRSLRLRGGTGAAPARLPAETAPQATASVLGLRRAMNRGEVITEADLIRLDAPTSGAETTFALPGDVVGRRLTRAIAPDRPLLARHLDPAVLVEKDQPVVIQSAGRGLQVSMRGQSLGPGAAGDLIEVLNLSSGRTVTARVIGRDTVEVALKFFPQEP